MTLSRVQIDVQVASQAREAQECEGEKEPQPFFL